MKIAITGSSGHLGEAICHQLKSKGIDFLGIDIKAGPYTKLVGSITNSSIVDKLLENVDYVIHTATLHKPHIVTHSEKAFIDTNITGTLTLLESCVQNAVKGIIYTSTTSTFGDVLNPKDNEPAIWVDEEVVPKPKNIYGVTKSAAEDLCQLYYRNKGLPCIVLKTSRFFMEEDDNRAMREQYDDLNIKANELLHRRVDIEDVVDAHLLALEKIETLGFEKFVISATSPFEKSDLARLHVNAEELVKEKFPDYEELYKSRYWKMFPKIGRVYVNKKARAMLGWNPKYDFSHILNSLKNNKDFRSELSLKIGAKGYHDTVFEDGPYPVQ